MSQVETFEQGLCVAAMTADWPVWAEFLVYSNPNDRMTAGLLYELRKTNCQVEFAGVRNSKVCKVLKRRVTKPAFAKTS